MATKDNKKKLSRQEKSELLDLVAAKFKKGSDNSLLQYIERQRESIRQAIRSAQ
jgi:hypothetical protein